MSLHRITAGSGYDYLTRQVAAMDSTEKGHTGLASYYTEKGEVPGRWVGSGMAGIDGLNSGDIVTAEQVLSLFGSGHHPLAQQRKRDLAVPGLTEKDYVGITRLGEPFRVYDNDISPFRIEVARRLEALNVQRGLPRKAATAIEDRARIRSQVALEMFQLEHGRSPLGERELAGYVAKLSRQQTTAVAGFDLTFSPVKSVSALWALADPTLAATIERCHQMAVADALSFIERHALFTRTGTDGVRQVDVRGLVATAFTHRDSRAGDPDLHTHVAVANKVQTLTYGRWLSIDSRVLHKAVVTASETYNTALERHLAEALRVRFAPREDTDPRKRPIREIIGVDVSLNRRWSTRRQSIEVRRRDLAARFQEDHCRPPTPVEAIALAQQATLETREAKHEPRILAEQRATWRAQAGEVLGGETGIQAMLHTALHPAPADRPIPTRAWLEQSARRVVAVVQRDRSTWQTWHLRAEAQRCVRAVEVPAQHVETVVDLLVDQALTYCQALTRPIPGEPEEPAPLRRSDGASVYTVAGSQLYTSNAILAAEARLVAAAGRHDGLVVPAAALDLALLEATANGADLNPGQVLLVREMATSGARVQLAIAPAGSGKTTAMNALSRAWTEAGGTAIGLAPSAAAAAALGEQLIGSSDTLAKLVWSLQHGQTPEWVARIGPKTLVIIDEAGMADTLSLDIVVQHVVERGGSVRLIGDDQQLAAIGAGGVLRDIQAGHGALRLTELVRFTDRAEGSASLALRDGRTAALGFYLDQRRVHVGDATTMADDLFAAWSADSAGGLDSIMLAPTRDLVADLNQRARAQRLAGTRPDREVELADGNLASVGDVPAKVSARLRFYATGQGRKTDDTDAHSIALVGVRMTGLRPVVSNAQREMLRLLVDRRRRFGEEHTVKVCQLHQLLLELIPGGAKRYLSAAQARRLLAGVQPSDLVSATRKRVAMELVEDLERIYQRSKAADKELVALVKNTRTGLLGLHGIGPSGAARLLVEVGDITRFPTKGHFASWTGTAPIDASSGDHVRHRLSRGGNRQINRVLHLMAVVQLRNPTEGRTYFDRKKTDGKTTMEAMRCLKRRLSDIVYKTMLTDYVTIEATGPGGHRGTTLTSSVADSIPNAGASEKSLPGPVTGQRRTPRAVTA